jgi:hypothetical protein
MGSGNKRERSGNETSATKMIVFVKCPTLLATASGVAWSYFWFRKITPQYAFA